MPKGRILAIDDQRYFRELLEGILSEEGYEVQTASGGEEALRILEHTSFDVIVTDLVMPVMSGTDLVQHVRERWPEQDVVVVTGVVDVKSAVDAMKVGATDYILKPFDRETLSSSLDAILESHRLAAERDRLLAENIEYMGERFFFEQALALFSALSLEALAQAILKGLCHETGAQGAVLWLGSDRTPETLNLFAARGLVRPEDERGRGKVLGHNAGRQEDPRPDRDPRHDHGGVEQSEPSREPQGHDRSLRRSWGNTIQCLGRLVGGAGHRTGLEGVSRPGESPAAVDPA